MSEKKLSVFEDNNHKMMNIQRFSTTPQKQGTPSNKSAPSNSPMSSPSTIIKQKMKNYAYSELTPNKTPKTNGNMSTPPKMLSFSMSAKKSLPNCPSPFLYKPSPVKEKQIEEHLQEFEFKKELHEKYATTRFSFDKNGHFKPRHELYAELKQIHNQYKIQIPEDKKYTPLAGKSPRKSPIKGGSAVIDDDDEPKTSTVVNIHVSSPIRDRMKEYSEKLRKEAKKKFEESSKKKKAAYEIEIGTQQAFDEMETKLNTDLINRERDMNLKVVGNLEEERNRNPFNSPLHQKLNLKRRPFFQ